ncbi:hypothetical protein GCM10010402_66720 [Actinomadura luteofluorescens]
MQWLTYDGRRPRRARGRPRPVDRPKPTGHMAAWGHPGLAHPRPVLRRAIAAPVRPRAGTGARLAFSGHDKHLTEDADSQWRALRGHRPGSRHMSQTGGHPLPGSGNSRVTRKPNRS